MKEQRPTLESTLPLDYTTSRPDRAGRFHQLDGLRAVAVSLILVHHSLTTPIASELTRAGMMHVELGSQAFGQAMLYLARLLHYTTASGVELFFVLSGIVLLRPYLRKVRLFNVGSYFRRRAQRLWPPYLLSLLSAGLLLWIMQLYPTWYYDSLPEHERRFTFWGWFSQIGILNLGWDMYNVAWWSLTVELIFYLVAPLLVPIFASRAMTRLMFMAVMMFSIVAAAALVFAFGDPILRDRSTAQAFLNFGAYVPCFVLGLAIAKYDMPGRVGMLLVGSGLCYVLIANHFSEFNVHAGFGLLYAGLVVMAFNVGSVWTRFLSSPLMVWLGERSYSLFLIHFTVFIGVNYGVSWVVPEKTGTYFLLTRLIGLPGAVLAAMVMFHFAERHFARNLLTDKYFWPILSLPEPSVENPSVAPEQTIISSRSFD